MITHWAGLEFVYPADFEPSNNVGAPVPNPLVRGTSLIGETRVDNLNRSTEDWHSRVCLSYTGDGHTSACQGDPLLPHSTVVDNPKAEPAEMLAARRRARYGDLLPRHILWRCATGRHPTEIAAVLGCSRSSVYRTVRAYQAGALDGESDAQGRLVPPGRTTVLLPTRRRSLLALLNAPPRA